MSWHIDKASNLTFESMVLQRVIQAAHLYLSRKSQVPTWQRIVYWSELYYQKAITDPQVPQPKTYKSAVSLLNVLFNWYHDLFLSSVDDIEPIINVPVYLELGHDIVYRDSIPIVTIGKTVKLIDFRQIDKPRNLGIIDIYNDLAAHVRIWGFEEVTGQMPSHYVRAFILPESIKMVEVKTSKDLLANAAKISKHIITGMKDRVYYPSFSEQCAHCPFKSGCSI